MSTAAATLYDGPTSIGNAQTALSGPFSVAAFRPEGTQYADNMNRASKISETGELDTYELNPWQVTIHDQLFVLIRSGEIDAAINLLERHMTNFSQAHQVGTLQALDRALNNLSDIGYTSQISLFSERLAEQNWFQNLLADPKQAITCIFAADRGFDAMNMSKDMGSTGIGNIAKDQLPFDPSALIGTIVTRANERLEFERAPKPQINPAALAHEETLRGRRPPAPTPPWELRFAA